MQPLKIGAQGHTPKVKIGKGKADSKVNVKEIAEAVIGNPEKYKVKWIVENGSHGIHCG